MDILFQPSEAEQPVVDSRRPEPRARVALAATLETLEGQRHGFVLNLSCHGAMLQTASVLRCGSNLLLRCAPIDVLATVKWIEGDRAGLAFEETVDEHQVIELRERADQLANLARIDSVGDAELEARALTPIEREAAEEWAKLCPRLETQSDPPSDESGEIDGC